MPERPLDQPATVRWFSSPGADGTMRGDSKKLSSLERAVCFVMEELSAVEPEWSRVDIALDGESFIGYAEIERIYKTL